MLKLNGDNGVEGDSTSAARGSEEAEAALVVLREEPFGFNGVAEVG